MWQDALHDNLIIQQATAVDDGGFGQDITWDGVLRVKGRVRQLSSKEAADIHGRESNEIVYRVYSSDRISRTDGQDSLHRLLTVAGEEKFRVVWRGDRTLTPISIERPAAGRHDHVSDVMWIDCVEVTQGTGYTDL